MACFFFQFLLGFKNEMIWFNKDKTGIIMVFFWHKNMGLPKTRVIMAMAGKSPKCSYKMNIAMLTIVKPRTCKKCLHVH